MQVRNYNYRQDVTFDWDSLALISRNNNTYINEPAVTGGNPILSNDTVMFNDMLGSTYATNSNGNITSIERTQFGVTDTKTEEFFTGKPHIKDMGYAFIFRNYRSELSKWQSADPIGYPDGLNNFAYVNNWVIGAIDTLGTDIYHVLANDAVGGLGHSAAIVGNDTFGYRIMNHGSPLGIGDSKNNWASKYNTLAEALADLDKGRTGDDAYTHIQKWETTPAEDDIAYQKMLDSASEPYSSATNNCWQVIQDGIREVDWCTTAIIPCTAYLDNLLLFGADGLNIDDIRNGTAE